MNKYNKKPCIVLVSTDYKPLLGGIVEMGYQVALALNRAGWEVVMLAPYCDDEVKEFDFQNPFETIRAIPRRGKGMWTKSISALKHRTFFQSFRRLVENHRDVYILVADTGICGGYLGFLRWLVLSASHIPKGIIFHGKDVVIVPRMPMIKRRLFSNISKFQLKNIGSKS